MISVISPPKRGTIICLLPAGACYCKQKNGFLALALTLAQWGVSEAAWSKLTSSCKGKAPEQFFLLTMIVLYCGGRVSLSRCFQNKNIGVKAWLFHKDDHKRSHSASTHIWIIASHTVHAAHRHQSTGINILQLHTIQQGPSAIMSSFLPFCT